MKYRFPKPIIYRFRKPILITELMKIIVSQQNKKLLINFKSGKLVDNYAIDKADGFLNVLDRFIKKRKMKLVVLKKADLEFVNVGMLTERVIRAIMLGLRFYFNSPPK